MKAWILGAATTLAVAASAHAGVIVSPTAITASTTFPGYDVNNLINQSGLTAGFVSGVSDFDTYMAGNPGHSWALEGEWFTTFDQPGAVLNMDLGAVFKVLRLALWTDEYWGAGKVTIATSLDGVTYGDVGEGLPTDWATGPQDYPADVFALAPSTARYVRLTLSDCPQPKSASGGGCGLGEIAFEAGGVPEPATWAMMIAGFGVLGAAARRRRTAAVAP